MKRFFFINNFQKEKANTLTLLIILKVKVKSLKIELHSTNLLLTKGQLILKANFSVFNSPKKQT